MASLPVMRFCLRCKSENIRVIEYLGVECIVCNDCGYDGREQYEMYPQQRTSQREKTRFTPYKAGGAQRTVKK